MSSVDRQQRRTSGSSGSEIVSVLYSTKSPLREAGGWEVWTLCSMLFPFISRPEPPLMKRVLLVTRLRLRPLMPMKQVFEQSFGQQVQSFFTSNSNRQGALNRTRLMRYWSDCPVRTPTYSSKNRKWKGKIAIPTILSPPNSCVQMETTYSELTAFMLR